MTENPRIAVIGAGLSGLATAVELKLAGFDVTVLESAPRIGGVIHTEQIDVPGIGTFIIDHGADMFATQPPAAIDLCRRLGVEDRLLKPNLHGRGAMIARGQSLVPIPEGFVLMRATKLSSMITTSLLSPAGKLRLLVERFVRRRPADVRDESVGSFVRRRMGNEVLQRIVAPLVAGIYTADVERLSMAATMKPIWDMESHDGSLTAATLRRRRSGEDRTESGSSGARYEQFRAFPGGMIDWMTTLADAIGHDRVHLNCPAESLSADGGRIRVHPDHDAFDDVVLAVPAAASARLLATFDDACHHDAIQTVVSDLNSIPTASTAIVVMAVRRTSVARMPATFGFVVPPSENRRILAGSFASEKFAGRAPEGYVIIRAFVGGVLQPDILSQSDESIVGLVRDELHELIGLDNTAPLTDIAPVVRVVRWNEAMPQYEVGHVDKATRIKTAMASIPHIHLAGNSLDGVGIAPVIAAAARLASSQIKGVRTL